MPAKKSAKGAPQPILKKSIQDVAKFLRDNPDYGIAFHEYFESQVRDINRSGWSVGTSYADQKSNFGAQCLTTEVLDVMNLYDLVKK